MTDAEVGSADAYYGKRLSSLQAVDEAIEHIHKTLLDDKVLDNTYIVFASDNGFHLGEHRMRRGKQTAYETDIHLPLIIRGPGVVAGSKPHELAGNIDLAPTFAALAGAKVPDFVDGRSLVPLLHPDSSDRSNWRKVFLTEHWLMERKGANASQSKSGGPSLQATPELDDEPMQETNDNKPKLAPKVPLDVNGDPLVHVVNVRTRKNGRIKRKRNGARLGGIPELHAIRTPDSTFVEYITGEREYYNLKDDEAQANNLANTLDEKQLKEKSDLLDALKKGAGAAVRQTETHF